MHDGVDRLIFEGLNKILIEAYFKVARNKVYFISDLAKDDMIWCGTEMLFSVYDM